MFEICLDLKFIPPWCFVLSVTWLHAMIRSENICFASSLCYTLTSYAVISEFGMFCFTVAMLLTQAIFSCHTYALQPGLSGSEGEKMTNLSLIYAKWLQNKR